MSNFKCQISNWKSHTALLLSASWRRAKLEILAKWRAGQSLVEFIIAVTILLIVAGSSTVLVLSSFSTTRLSEEGSYAVFLAEEALEAVRSIKNRDFGLLTNGAHGLQSGTGIWEFTGTPNSIGKYTRTVTVSSVNRANGDIVTSGGVADPETKRVVTTVSWNFTPTRSNSVTFTQYFTNWQISRAKSGVAISCLSAQADCLFLNTSNMDISSNGRQLRGLTLNNTDTTNSIVLDKMTVSWVGSVANMDRIRINAVDVWTGNVPSGTEVDISNVTLSAGINNIPINHIRFTSSVSSTVFSILFSMNDGSTKTITGIDP